MFWVWSISEMAEKVDVNVGGAPFQGVVEEAPSLLEHETVNREFTPRAGIAFTRLVRLGESLEYITHETYQGVMASRLLLYVGFGAMPHPNGVRLPGGVEEGRDYLLLLEVGECLLILSVFLTSSNLSAVCLSVLR